MNAASGTTYVRNSGAASNVPASVRTVSSPQKVLQILTASSTISRVLVDAPLVSMERHSIRANYVAIIYIGLPDDTDRPTLATGARAPLSHAPLSHAGEVGSANSLLNHGATKLREALQLVGARFLHHVVDLLFA
jgi:hypothetical protein